MPLRLQIKIDCDGGDGYCPESVTYPHRGITAARDRARLAGWSVPSRGPALCPRHRPDREG